MKFSMSHDGVPRTPLILKVKISLREMAEHLVTDHFQRTGKLASSEKRLQEFKQELTDHLDKFTNPEIFRAIKTDILYRGLKPKGELLSFARLSEEIEKYLCKRFSGHYTCLDLEQDKKYVYNCKQE